MLLLVLCYTRNAQIPQNKVSDIHRAPLADFAHNWSLLRFSFVRRRANYAASQSSWPISVGTTVASGWRTVIQKLVSGPAGSRGPTRFIKHELHGSSGCTGMVSRKSTNETSPCGLPTPRRGIVLTNTLVILWHVIVANVWCEFF